MVGHEGAGSAVATLRRRGWATGLEAGVGATGLESSRVGALFHVTVSRKKRKKSRKGRNARAHMRRAGGWVGLIWNSHCGWVGGWVCGYLLFCVSIIVVGALAVVVVVLVF